MVSINHLIQTDKVTGYLQSVFTWLARPRHLARVQLILLAPLVFWGAHSVSRGVWAFWPSETIGVVEPSIINPVTATDHQDKSVSVDLEPLLGLGLFGDPVDDDTSPTDDIPAQLVPREGIETGARETRLDVVLTGILASTDAGLGTAVIEAGGRQVNYGVGDTLPVAGAVTVAKVMPTQVVLDNNGTYELLKLFDDDGLAKTLTSARAVATGTARSEPARTPTVPESEGVASQEPGRVSVAAARDYRDQLYNDPQSLSRIVRIAAVRDAQGLKGYRVAPGSEAAEFRALGFKSGDVITAVNGLELSDPANTLRLYQLMRDASGAVFEVERGDSQLTISVSLGATDQEKVH